MFTKSLLLFGTGVLLLIGTGCTSVQMMQKPAAAVELRGVVEDQSSVPYGGLPTGQQAAVTAAGGLIGAGIVGAIDSQLGNRGVSTVTVRVAPSLALVVPTNGGLKPGECVKLHIDPIYRDLLARRDVPNMSLPVNSTYIERISC